MSKRTMPEVVTESVREHPAVQAWLQIRSDCGEIGSLELLQRRRHSTVYRLNHGKRDGSRVIANSRVIAKRCRIATARIERAIYEDLLPLTGMPALACYGLQEEPEGQYGWLFLEDAAGARYSPQLHHDCALAGCWLAETQLTAVPHDVKSCLPDRELDHYLLLLRNCRAMLMRHLNGSSLSAADAEVFRNIAVHLDAIESLWGELVEICDVMPRTLVHGDFVNKNLRVRDSVNGNVLLVFDWEFAGWGVPAADLAQLIDRVASPDLNLYCSILKREYSHLHLCDIQAVASCGNLLRLVDQMSWATVGQEFVLPTDLVKATALLRSYEPSILGALSAFQRSWT